LEILPIPHSLAFPCHPLHIMAYRLKWFVKSTFSSYTALAIQKYKG
jgi:hypothetical protein